ncbi:MAG: DegT/DnrJ/EryC1/StrS family aminotransferase, partial [Bacteroidales bacterium]
DLPLGYDHKYVYSHFGYNLKVTDMQAAIGCAQLDKLPSIIKARKENWNYLRLALQAYSAQLILPQASENTDPSWFGFLICVRPEAGFTRNTLVSHLEKNNIQTRMLFAGNLIKHPCFDQMRNAQTGFRVVGDLKNTDQIMKDVFWIGVYPGMSKKMLDYMIEKIGEVCQNEK